LGHEAVVEVVAHRRPESDLMEGDRLTFSIADSCNKCEFCLKGLQQKCTKLFKVKFMFILIFIASIYLVWSCKIK
jgi:D-arabinose 1-dehydrogenase-like Zn-dependent alcohol dehydrogenase